MVTSANSLASDSAGLKLETASQERIVVCLSGDWRLGEPHPKPEDVGGAVGGSVKQISFDTTALGRWDSALLVFLDRLVRWSAQQSIEVDLAGLPEGAQRLLGLARAVPPAGEADSGRRAPTVLEGIGQAAIDFATGAPEMLRFIGEAVISLGRFLVGRAQYRSRDLWLIVQEVGPQALPIVSLLAFLVGLILAYMGAIQLRKFGTEIYVANMVSIAMAREMGALMTAIIVAGRSGAAFAAQLGTMEANEEIDALKTLGIRPIDFLVLPRMLALSLMVPLLTLYADIVGMAAGMLIGVTILDLGALEYYRQTLDSLTLEHIGAGLFKACVYGLLVALAGCLRGMQSGRSAAAVGEATTSAVVTSIVFIISAGAVLTVVYDVLGI